MIAPVIGVVAYNPPAHRPTLDQMEACLVALGAQATREIAYWSDVEVRKRVYTIPTAFAARIAANRAAGRKTVVVLGVGNAFYPGSGGWNTHPSDQASCDAFGAYAAFLLSQMHGDDLFWEIDNEPNNAQFWPGCSAAGYARLVVSVVEAMTAVPVYGATARIGLGGVGTPGVAGSIGYLGFITDTLLALPPAIRAGLHAASLHPYNPGPPETLFAAIATFRAVTGWTGPLWLTEWGYCASWIKGDEAVRADYVRRMITAAVAAQVEILTIYCMNDNGVAGDEGTFGLCDLNYQPKAAGKIFRNMTDALNK